MDGKKLSHEEIANLLIEKTMKPGKKKWSYRCQKCQETFDSVNHKKYVLIDVERLHGNFQLSVTGTHEGTMFCSKECASAAIRDTNIYTMYEDLKEGLNIFVEENLHQQQLLQRVVTYLRAADNYTDEDLTDEAKESLLELIEILFKQTQRINKVN